MSINESLNIQTKKMYRAKEVSKLLGIGLSTVWLYAKQGKLTPIKVSSRVTVFDTEEVLALFSGEVHNEK